MSASHQVQFPIAVVQDAFRRVRKEFHLGVGELQAAIDAVQAGFGAADGEALGRVLRSLWCHSVMDQMRWDMQWRKVLADLVREDPEALRMGDRTETEGKQDDRGERSQSKRAENTTQGQPLQSMAPTVKAGFSALPVQVPTNIEEMDEFELRAVAPVTRRSMSYGWRSMRQLRADGPRTVVDIGATIAQVGREGFYTGPVMRRCRVNHAKLLLLVDQQGSMVPFHRWSRDLVETAVDDPTLEWVRVFYFYNTPQDAMYLDEHLTVPIALTEVLDTIDAETTVMVVSDGGAARGRRDKHRIRETTRFLGKVRLRTEGVGWLNPMPRERWERSAAEILGYIVPMESMDEESFVQMLRVVTGRSIVTDFSMDLE